MSKQKNTFMSENSDSFQKLTEAIQRNADYPMTEKEKKEAARNLIAFFKTLLEIQQRIMENQKHDKHP